MFDVRIAYTLHLPFQVYLFYLSSQLRWIAKIFCVCSENALLNFKLRLACIHIFSIYLQSLLSLEFNCFYRFYKIFNMKDNVLTCSLTKSNTHLYKNTHDREAASYLTHHHSFLADIHLQLENSYTVTECFSQALHALWILHLG